jgi:hypothetical protein
MAVTSQAAPEKLTVAITGACVLRIDGEGWHQSWRREWGGAQQ